MFAHLFVYFSFLPLRSRVKPVEYSQMYSCYNQYYQQYQNYYAQWGYDQNTGITATVIPSTATPRAPCR